MPQTTPGAQCSILEPVGWRHQVFIAIGIDDEIACVEVRYRGHARVEDRTKNGDDAELDHFPGQELAANARRLTAIRH